MKLGGSPHPAAPADIDEFRLVRMLGRGGMGAVYLAHDTILDRAVALKLVAIGTNEESRLRFLNEARAIARLDHPNVIAIFRAGTTGNGEPYLVQELVRGQSLDLLALPVAVRRGLELATGIARGLAAAHRRGVLHRDVKPSNIMIDEVGTPRLLDFGLAKLSGRHLEGAGPGASDAPAAGAFDRTAGAATPGPFASLPLDVAATAELPGAALEGVARAVGSSGPAADDDSGQTHAGAILGTPRYMAPEVWRGEVATARSDLYSLGVVMYELLTGEPPFPASERAALERAVLEGPPPPPIAERVAGLEAELAGLITRCLAREASERPESADEVVFQLERIAAGAPPIPEGNPYRGLAAFEVEQRALFFGRGSEISAIVDRLRSEALVVVAGDSGIGKSSLCRAGVVPAIVGGALGDGRSWRGRTVTLGRTPASALAAALELDALPETGERGQLATQLARQLAGSAEHGLLLFVDQLEELVTQSAGAEAAQVAAVLAALGSGVPGVKVLVAVRGDFLTRVAALPSLRGVMTRSLHLLRGLSADDARDAVVSPARAKGVRFESEAMVEALVASIADRPAALPLLQFALSELWSRRAVDRAVIPAGALAEIGGVAGALASAADQVITALAAPERAAARRILVALVTAEGTRASRVRAELVASDDTAAALEALVRGRLVVARDVADGAPVYELAHESLLAAWGTLRGWLDDAAGQRGIRTRLSAAADEWHRLGRRRELLWRRAQVAEARHLVDLTVGDQAFLAASRGAAQLRLALTLAIAAAVPAAAVLTWWTVARGEQARREQVVDERLARARAIVTTARGRLTEARRVQTEAIERFHQAAAPRLVLPAPGWLQSTVKRLEDQRSEAREDRWAEAERLFAQARRELGDATREIEAVLQVDARRAEVRRVMAATIFEQAELADELRDEEAARDLEARLATYDDGSYLARWRQPVAVTLEAARATRLELARYLGEPEGEKELSAPVRRVPGAQLRTTLAPGSYRATVWATGLEPVYAPFVVRRGAAMSLQVPLPAPGQVPDGFVFIPAGAFLHGSDDRHQPGLTWTRRIHFRAPPLYRETTGSYLIARHEVTFGEWLTYLRSLPVAERELRRQQGSLAQQRSVRLDEQPDGSFVLSLRTLDRIYTAREGAPLTFPERNRRSSVRWERTPVGGVPRDHAIAYATWLSATGRVPGARLCTPLEWERAARGADGRRYPHGERLLRDDANIDVTYDRESPGPDEVGAHPASASPFGVMDLSGNAFEWVVNGPETTLRGGSWWAGAVGAATMNDTAGQPNRTEAFLGIRLCADAPASASGSTSAPASAPPAATEPARSSR